MSEQINTITVLLDRRQALMTLGALRLLGCGAGESDSSSAANGGGSSGGGSSASCALIPQETQGPYPLLAILSHSTMLRSDITEGKTRVPLQLVLKFVNLNNSCTALTNAAVYIWHCDKDGVYSGYSQPGGNTVGRTFCRGLQVTDSKGEVALSTIYPSWGASPICISRLISPTT